MSAGPLIDYLGLILSPTVAPAQGDVPARGPSGGWTTIQPGAVGGYVQVDPNALSGQALVFRTDGTVARVNPPAIEAQAWNVSPTSPSSTNAVNLQLAITAATANLGAGSGGPAGKINLGPNVITVDRAILDKFGVKLYGVGGQVNTTLKADPSAPLSNFQNGSKSTFPAILKWDGDDIWAHGVHVVGIHFDTSGIPGLSATWFQATGENSWFDDLSCSSCAALPRTVTDAQLVAGSATVSFTASTVTEDDVNAILNMGGNTVAPLAPGLSTAGTGGTIGSTSQAQQFTVGITYQTANGETIVSPLTSITVAQVATNTITIASPVAATGATGWVAYVSQPGGGGIIWRQGGVNAIGTSLTLTAPPVNNGISPYNKIDRISWGTNSNAATATSMVMRNPAVATLANVTMVINRPTDAFVFDGGFTPGTIGKLHGVNNSGAVFRSKNAAGTCIINQLSGDDNVGGMARMSTAAQHGDPTFLQINNIKAESDTYNPNWQYSMDPVVLIDRGWTYAINLHGGSFAGGGYVRDVVRLDNSWANTDVGGPSLHLGGVEGQNWYNTAYTNIIHDTQSGESIPVSAYGEQQAYPNIEWNRRTKLGGGADFPDLADWDRFLSVADIDPPLKYNSATTNWTSGAFYLGAVRFNQSNLQNDGFGWYVRISKGTWNLNVQGAKGPSYAIQTWDFSMDGGVTWTTIGTLDAYVATATAWFSGQISGVVLPKVGVMTLRCRVLTRNASNTTGWNIGLSSIHLQRTA